jgi:hypothetical protein
MSTQRQYAAAPENGNSMIPIPTATLFGIAVLLAGHQMRRHIRAAELDLQWPTMARWRRNARKPGYSRS